MRVVFLGLAGAGKGTQAQLLARRLQVPFVSSGDIFRHHQAQATELGLLAKRFMERGELVPDEVTIRMILERIGSEDCRNGFVLDGFPRTIAQAKALDQALATEGLDYAVHVKVGEKELVRRLSGRISCRQCGTPFQRDSLPTGATRCPACGGDLFQRPDDEPTVVRRRLQAQRPELTYLVQYYAKQEKLLEVIGEQTVEEVENEVLKLLSLYSTTP